MSFFSTPAIPFPPFLCTMAVQSRTGMLRLSAIILRAEKPIMRQGQPRLVPRTHQKLFVRHWLKRWELASIFCDVFCEAFSSYVLSFLFVQRSTAVTESHCMLVEPGRVGAGSENYSSNVLSRFPTSIFTSCGFFLQNSKEVPCRLFNCHFFAKLPFLSKWGISSASGGNEAPFS